MVNTEKKFYFFKTNNGLMFFNHYHAMDYLLDEFFIRGRASILFRNLLILSLPILLSGCTNTEDGGNFPSS